ncbi:MAG: hypothetical protein IJZ23_10380 [Roseburia sp.]|nr:hypothetical protein [Roseburia sp.]
MENNNERFEYTYSARQQEEVEKIRRKYMPQEEDGLAKLKRLDEQVTRPGMIAGLTLGLIGTLIFGAGMSMALVWTDTLLVAGILVGILGFITLGAAYPAYHKITEKQKAKLAPQILELTEQLSR